MIPIMVDIPDPLPRDVEALQKLARNLMRENQKDRLQLKRMQELLDVLGPLVEQEEEDSQESE